MTFWQWALTICGGLATLAGAISAVKKLISPLTELSDRVKKVEEHDKRDKQRLDDYEDRFMQQKKENQAILKALVAMMGHHIDGNSVDKMKEARAALVVHIIEN